MECSAFADNSAICICGRTISGRVEEGRRIAVDLLPASVIQKHGLECEDKGGIPQEQREVQGDQMIYPLIIFIHHQNEVILPGRMCYSSTLSIDLGFHHHPYTHSQEKRY